MASLNGGCTVDIAFGERDYTAVGAIRNVELWLFGFVVSLRLKLGDKPPHCRLLHHYSRFVGQRTDGVG